MRLLARTLQYIGYLTIGLTFNVVAQDATHSNKNTLPEIGVVASDALPLNKEIIIGDAVMRQMRAQSPIISDPILDEYLQDLGNRLVAQAENVKFPFKFFWVNNNALNAFAFFGGHIGIHTGLIFKAETESELASVLAHEVAHVTQRHLARRIQSQQRSTPIAIASMLGGILVAMADPQAGIAVMQSGAAASAQMQIDYTRSNEQEADRIGIAMLSRANFDPDGASSFFSTLAEEYRLVSRPPARLLSHPLTETRIADARARANDYPQVRVSESLSFHLARARVMARYVFDKDYALEYFKAAVEKNSFRIPQAAQYGLAISYLRNEEYNKAEEIMATLLKQHSENLFYLDVATDISIEKKQYDEAIERLAPHLARKPRNQVLALNQANVMIESGQYQSAIAILKDFLLVNNQYQLPYQLLTEAYKKSRQLKDMHQAKAETLALYGAYSHAVDELQHAYNFADNNHLEKQKIRARIKQLREEEERLIRL
ncbi:M48 family metalloprotease [Alteromonas sp. ASW11-130]|uniref:beta-barrel assembly-enhancing protease n=1 Tax=Alteromonas sp. ASW11-130 TaxID=3015775 RepID=UPI002242781B|nr:M48 family metalloprotease [Alteromonas sp. ASW11-130]MCW8092420.1 M48 family metalloprotease [Alteromonas sp. ASW11-130]